MKTLDIHGNITSEATIKVKAFLKEAFNSREYFVLIIHGQGKFILQKEVVKICKSSIYVDRYELAPPQIGGAGATLIYLKRKGIVNEKNIIL